jgi:ribosome maturation factor RimP
LLDAVEFIPGAYDLEVSSPGVERRLRLKSDFERVIGSEVKLKLNEAIEGRGANLTGILLRVDEDSIVVNVSGGELAIPLNKVKKANLVWHFK